MAQGPQNKSELKARIRDMTAEDQLDETTLDHLVALADADIKRELRVLEVERSVDLTLANELETVPTRFLGVRSFWLATSGGRQRLRRLGSEQLLTEYGFSSVGTPLAYAIEGRENALPVFRLAPIPDASYSAVLLYSADPALLADEDSNEILLKWPDIYVYGALVHAAPYLNSPERVSEFGTFYQRAIDGTVAADRRDRWSGSTLSVTPAYGEGC